MVERLKVTRLRVRQRLKKQRARVTRLRPTTSSSSQTIKSTRTSTNGTSQPIVTSSLQRDRDSALQTFNAISDRSDKLEKDLKSAKTVTEIRVARKNLDDHNKEYRKAKTTYIVSNEKLRESKGKLSKKEQLARVQTIKQQAKQPVQAPQLSNAQIETRAGAIVREIDRNPNITNRELINKGYSTREIAFAGKVQLNKDLYNRNLNLAKQGKKIQTRELLNAGVSSKLVTELAEVATGVRDVTKYKNLSTEKIFSSLSPTRTVDVASQQSAYKIAVNKELSKTGFGFKPLSALTSIKTYERVYRKAILLKEQLDNYTPLPKNNRELTNFILKKIPSAKLKPLFGKTGNAFEKSFETLLIADKKLRDKILSSKFGKLSYVRTYIEKLNKDDVKAQGFLKGMKSVRRDEGLLLARDYLKGSGGDFFKEFSNVKAKSIPYSVYKGVFSIAGFLVRVVVNPLNKNKVNILTDNIGSEAVKLFYNYGKKLRTRFEGGENNPLIKDVKKITDGTISAGTFVKNNPEASLIIAGVAGSNFGGDFFKEYKKDPVQGLTVAALSLTPNRSLALAKKSYNITSKPLRKVLSKSFSKNSNRLVNANGQLLGSIPEWDVTFDKTKFIKQLREESLKLLKESEKLNKRKSKLKLEGKFNAELNKALSKLESKAKKIENSLKVSKLKPETVGKGLTLVFDDLKKVSQPLLQSKVIPAKEIKGFKDSLNSLSKLKADLIETTALPFIKSKSKKRILEEIENIDKLIVALTSNQKKLSQAYTSSQSLTQRKNLLNKLKTMIERYKHQPTFNKEFHILKKKLSNEFNGFDKYLYLAKSTLKQKFPKRLSKAILLYRRGLEINSLSNAKTIQLINSLKKFNKGGKLIKETVKSRQVKLKSSKKKIDRNRLTKSELDDILSSTKKDLAGRFKEIDKKINAIKTELSIARTQLVDPVKIKQLEVKANGMIESLINVKRRLKKGDSIRLNQKQIGLRQKRFNENVRSKPIKILNKEITDTSTKFTIKIGNIEFQIELRKGASLRKNKKGRLQSPLSITIQKGVRRNIEKEYGRNVIKEFIKDTNKKFKNDFIVKRINTRFNDIKKLDTKTKSKLSKDKIKLKGTTKAKLNSVLESSSKLQLKLQSQLALRLQQLLRGTLGVKISLRETQVLESQLKSQQQLQSKLELKLKDILKNDLPVVTSKPPKPAKSPQPPKKPSKPSSSTKIPPKPPKPPEKKKKIIKGGVSKEKKKLFKKISGSKLTFGKKLPSGYRRAYIALYRERKFVSKPFNKKSNPRVQKKLELLLPLNKSLSVVGKSVDSSLAQRLRIVAVGITKEKDLSKRPAVLKKFTLAKNKDKRSYTLQEHKKHLVDTIGEKNQLSLTRALSKAIKKKASKPTPKKKSTPKKKAKKVVKKKKKKVTSKPKKRKKVSKKSPKKNSKKKK